MRILALDTSTEACSAAVWLGEDQVRLRFELTERSHADLILPMIDSLLAEAGLTLQGLDGLAFGRGPGGFTGLRIAAGVVQGLAFAADLPVAPVSSLLAVAAQVPCEDGDGAILVCNDARMGEVYWAAYQGGSAGSVLDEIASEGVAPPEQVSFAMHLRHAAGNGIARHPVLQTRLQSAGVRWHEGLYPRADVIARLGAAALGRGEGVAAELALPTYVRDDVARVSAGNVAGMS